MKCSGVAYQTRCNNPVRDQTATDENTTLERVELSEDSQWTNVFHQMHSSTVYYSTTNKLKLMCIKPLWYSAVSLHHGKVGRLASESLTVELLKSKCLQSLFNFQLPSVWISNEKSNFLRKLSVSDNIICRLCAECSVLLCLTYLAIFHFCYLFFVLLVFLFLLPLTGADPGIWQRGRNFSLPSPSLLFSPLPAPLSLRSPLPLEVGPLNPARGLGSAVSSPSGAAIAILAYLEPRKGIWWQGFRFFLCP